MQVDQLVVVQPTPFCNIDCSYCYLPDRSNPSRMSDKVLRALYASVFSSTRLREPISFIWHSGEPLVLPIAYYDSALRICKEVNRAFGKNYSHGIQTNAMLLTIEWAKFFLANDVSVCVSIDGPQSLHDSFRRDRSGRGTHHKVMQGVRLLQECGVAFSVICVLTYDSLSQPHEIYDFFVGNAIHSIAFNIDEIEGPNHSSTFAREDAIALYREFHRKLLLKIHAGGNVLEVREYSRIFGVIAANRTDEFVEGTNRPFTVVSVDWKGNFSTFSPELLGSASLEYGNFILGNVTTDSLDACIHKPLFIKINSEIQAGVAACEKDCDYWSFCGGGAPANKYFESGRLSSTETLVCRVHTKALVDTVLDYIESVEN